MVLFKKTVYANCRILRILVISLIIAVLLRGTALANVELDLVNAEGVPGDEVQIPIFKRIIPLG